MTAAAPASPGHQIGDLARRMINQYEAELERTSATSETALAHRGIVEVLLADWRRRLVAVLANTAGDRG